MHDDGISSRRSIPGNHVDHARREARLLNERAQIQRRQRSLLGRFHHDRATRGQRRSPLPGQHQHRVVPGNDLPDHAHRLLPRVGQMRPIRGHRVAADLVRPAGVVPQTVHRPVHIVHGVHVRFAVIERLQRGKIVHVAFHQVGQLVQQLAARRSVHLAPHGLALESGLGGLHGQLHVGLVTLGHIDDFCPGRRVDRGEGLPANGVHKLVVDEQLGALDLRIRVGHIFFFLGRSTRTGNTRLAGAKSFAELLGPRPVVHL